MPQSSTGGQALKTAVSEGYKFEIISAVSGQWIVRTFFNSLYLADMVDEGVENTSGQLADPSKFAGELVSATRSAKAEYDTGARFDMAIVSKTAVTTTQVFSPENPALFNTVVRLSQDGILFVREGTANPQKIYGEDRSGVRTITDLQIAKNYLTKSNGSIILPHDTLSPVETTFNSGTLVYNFVTGEFAKGSTSVQYVGLDASGLPLMVAMTYSGGESSVLMPKCMIRGLKGGAPTIIDSAGAVRYTFNAQGPAYATLLLGLRNISFSASTSGSTTIITGSRVDGISVKLTVNNTNGSYTFQGPAIAMKRADGSAISIPFIAANPWLYLFGGYASELAKTMGISGVVAGGNPSIQSGGYVSVPDTGGNTRYYGNRAILYPDGQLDLLGGAGMVRIPKTDQLYNAALWFAQNEYDLYVSQVTAAGKEIDAMASFDPYLYALVTNPAGTQPYLYYFTAADLQYNPLSAMIMSNIMSMQHQTSMAIINNMAPTPVRYVYD